MTIHDVWYGKSISAKLVRALLVPASWLYSFGWRMYLLVYRLGVKKAAKPHKRILCVGNCTAGGTGKTPTVIFIAQQIAAIGHTVVIGCSGYGSPHAADATLAPDGPLDPTEWGDEPAEIRSALPDVPIIVGRARVTAASLVHQHFPDSVLLMDDGFQHLPLAKDSTIVLDSGSANRFTFPAGPYREPLSVGRKRASLVIGPSEAFSLEYSPLEFRDSNGTSIHISGPSGVLTAIGRPDLFRRSLEESGVEIGEFIAKGDHDPLDLDFGNLDPSVPWIVTEKDWVKLRKRSDVGTRRFVIAHRSVVISPLDEFRKWLTIDLA